MAEPVDLEDCAPAPGDLQDIMARLLDLAFYRRHAGAADLRRAVAHELTVRVSELPEVRQLSR